MRDFYLVPLAELRTHKSEKWRAFPEDVLPLPVAEMDFPVADPIRKTLSEMVNKSDLGYLGAIPEMGAAFAAFASKRFGWRPDPSQIRIAADVGVGIVETLRVITNYGDKILINSPVYPNFWTWCTETQLVQVDVPITQSETQVNGSNWILDWDGIEKAYASGIKAHLISNPHNPLGRIYTREELSRLADLAKKHNVYLLSDEIHAPLTFSEQTFTPFLAVSETAREVGITITAASKGWNIAGLKCAIIVSQGEKMHEKLNELPPALHYRASLLGAFATVAAFEKGDAWLDECIEILDENRNLIANLISSRIPAIGYSLPHASYLAWLDMSKLNLGEDPGLALIERAKVAFNSGHIYGANGKNYVRFNFATSPAIITEAIERIARAL